MSSEKRHWTIRFVTQCMFFQGDGMDALLGIQAWSSVAAIVLSSLVLFFEIRRLI